MKHTVKAERACIIGSVSESVVGGADNTTGKGSHQCSHEIVVVDSTNHIDMSKVVANILGVEHLRWNSIQNFTVHIWIADRVALDVKVLDHGSVDVRDIDGSLLFEPTIGAEAGAPFIELLAVAVLPHLIELLNGHLLEARIHGALERVAGRLTDSVADLCDLVSPVGSIEGEDSELVDEVDEGIVVLDFIGNAVLGQSLAESITVVGVPVTIAEAVGGVVFAVLLSAIPIRA